MPCTPMQMSCNNFAHNTICVISKILPVTWYTERKQIIRIRCKNKSKSKKWNEKS